MEPLDFDLDGLDGLASAASQGAFAAGGGLVSAGLYEVLTWPREREVQQPSGEKVTETGPLVGSAGLRVALLAVSGLVGGYGASLRSPAFGAGLAAGNMHAITREIIGLVRAKIADDKARKAGGAGGAGAEPLSAMFSPLPEDYEAEAALAEYGRTLRALPEEEELLADPSVLHEESFAEVDVDDEEELATLSAVVS